MDERSQAQIDEAQEVGLAIMRWIHAAGRAPIKVAAEARIFRASEKFRGDEDFTARDVLRILEALNVRSGRSRPLRRGENSQGTSTAAPLLLKVAEVATRLGVGTDWVYKRIERGEVPVVELGDSRKNQRVRESDLAKFIADRTHGTH